MASVVFLAWRDPAHPEAGGSEAYVHRMARELVAQGHEVTLRTARPAGSSRHEVIEGVRIDRRGGRLTVYPWGLLFLLLGRGRRCDVAVDVINGLPFGSVMARPGRTVALIHHVHREQWQMIYPDLRGRIGWLIESRVVPRLYRSVPVVTVSRATAQDLETVGFEESRISIIPNGLDIPGPPDGVPSMPTKHSQPRLIVLARLVPQKQIEHAIDLTAALRTDHPDLVLDIVGEGWWRDRLEAHALAAGIDDAVTFHGHVDEQDRDRLLRRAWLMVLPSVKEGWSIAVSEAAAMETPSIGYASSGGLNESIAHGSTGWIVQDYPELLAQVRAALRDPGELHTRGRAARRAALSLDWGRSGEAFAALIASRLSGRRR